MLSAQLKKMKQPIGGEDKMTREEKAFTGFIQGLSCSQAVASVFADRYGLDEAAVLKLSRGFGGGMGGMGGTCGALTGAYMVIGMHYDLEASQKASVYEKVREFTRLFQERHGNLCCRELLGCDVSSEEGKKIIKENNLRDTHCAEFVKNAVKILEEILH